MRPDTLRRRLLAGVACSLMLLLPSVTPAAAAGDDPAPQAWPTIQDPGNTGGSTDDPKQVDWPAVAQPDVGSATDPKPKQWPAPQQG